MPEKKTLNEDLFYKGSSQVPTCPVFTRAKIKSRFGIFVNLPSHWALVCYKSNLNTTIRTIMLLQGLHIDQIRPLRPSKDQDGV